jgi:hypothetical protein
MTPEAAIVAAQVTERRAWREAARCWQEFRNAPNLTPDDKAVRGLLLASAQSAEHFWRVCHADRVRLEQALT